MQATANTAPRIKDKPDNTDHSVHQVTAYTVIGVIVELTVFINRKANML